MPYLLILLLMASPQVTTGNFLFTSALPPKMVQVTVKIDFGPAARPAIEKEIMVRERVTPKEALKQMLPITEGKACCDPAEVKGIDGVLIDPMQNRWWKLQINGTTKKASPAKSHLKAGDRMEWIYFEDFQ